MRKKNWKIETYEKDGLTLERFVQYKTFMNIN